MTSVSTDAEIIALSILFVGLTIRFMTRDSIAIRSGLLLSLILLTVGKPVYLALGIILLSVHPRLGWRRAVSFAFSVVVSASLCYGAWSFLARPFFTGAGGAPTLQVQYLVHHPFGMLRILLLSLRANKLTLFTGAIGVLGWNELPMPPWFYQGTICFLGGAFLILAFSYSRFVISNLVLGGLAIIGLVVATYLAGWILWTPVGSPQVASIQGRYFQPAIAVLALMCPAFNRFSALQRTLLMFSAMLFVFVSSYSTIRITDHYFFSRSVLDGQPLRDMRLPASSSPCSASFESANSIRFAFLSDGRYTGSSRSRVLFVQDSGKILGEADPALAKNLLEMLWPRQSPSRWRLFLWNLNETASGHFWVVDTKSSCQIGELIQLQPYSGPEI